MPITDKSGNVLKPLSLDEQKRISEEIGRGKLLTYVLIVTSAHHSHRERKLVKKFISGQQIDENRLYCGISGDDIEEAMSCVDKLLYSNIPFLIISPHCWQLQNTSEFSWDSLIVQIKLKFFTSATERLKFKPKMSKLNQGYYLLFDTKTKKVTYISSKKIDKIKINDTDEF